MDNLFVLTDENDVVRCVSLIPGLGSFPETYHAYFPVCGKIPNVDEVFVPTLECNEHLFENGSTRESLRIENLIRFNNKEQAERSKHVLIEEIKSLRFDYTKIKELCDNAIEDNNKLLT